jgi:hypothetical protein
MENFYLVGIVFLLPQQLFAVDDKLYYRNSSQPKATKVNFVYEKLKFETRA